MSNNETTTSNAENLLVEDIALEEIGTAAPPAPSQLDQYRQEQKQKWKKQLEKDESIAQVLGALPTNINPDIDKISALLDKHDLNVQAVVNELTAPKIPAPPPPPAKNYSKRLSTTDTSNITSVLTNLSKPLAKQPYVPKTTWDENPELPIPAEIRQERACKSLTDLDGDTMALVFKYLRTRDLINLSVTCKTAKEKTDSNLLWKEQILNSQAKAAIRTYMMHKQQDYSRFDTLVYEKEKDPFLSTDFSYRKEYVEFKRRKTLETIGKKFVDNKEQEFNDNINDFQEIRYYPYGALLLLSCIGLYIFLVLIGVTLDNFIPINGYYWLIGYGFLLPPCAFFAIWFTIDVFKSRFYPVPSVASLNFKNNRAFEDNGIMITVFNTFTFVPLAIVLILIKLLALPNVAVWSYFFIPVYVLQLFSLVSSMMSAQVNFKFVNNNGKSLSKTIGVVFYGIAQVCFMCGMILVALKLDNIIPASFFWSPLLIPFYLSIYIIAFGNIVVWVNLGLQKGEVCDIWLGFVFSFAFMVVTAPITCTIILIGIKLDVAGVVGLYYIVSFSPILGGYLILIGLALIVAGCVALCGCLCNCCCCCCCYDDD